jgi:hypothetical protein
MIYNFISDPFPIHEPTTPPGREAKALWDRAAHLHTQLEDIESRSDDAQRAVREAREALGEHLQTAAMESKTATREKALTTALRAAEEKAAQPWAERQDAARRASGAAQSEVSAFMSANGPALLEEMRADAEAAADRAFFAVEQLRAALKDYDATGQRVVALTVQGIDGIDGRDVVNTSEWADDFQAGLRSVTDRESIPAPFVRDAVLAWRNGGQDSASAGVDTMLGAA